VQRPAVLWEGGWGWVVVRDPPEAQPKGFGCVEPWEALNRARVSPMAVFGVAMAQKNISHGDGDRASRLGTSCQRRGSAARGSFPRCLSCVTCSPGICPV